MALTFIERTAYPRFSRHKLKPSVLEALYTLTEEEINFVQTHLRKSKIAPPTPIDSLYDQNHFNALVLLKSFQYLGYFPNLADIPAQISDYIRDQLKLPKVLTPHYLNKHTLYRHQDWLRSYFDVKRYESGGKELAQKVALEASQQHNYPADIINSVLEALTQQHYELPPFIQLDRVVRRTRHQVNQSLFKSIAERLDPSLRKTWDDLLAPANRTGYNQLKQLPKSVSFKHFKELLAHHDWLWSFGDMSAFLQDLRPIKCQQFAGEARSLDASDLRDIAPHKRYALITCLVHHLQSQAKDHLVIMFIKTMDKIHKKAQERLLRLREAFQAKTRDYIHLLSEMVLAFKDHNPAQIEQHLLNYGGPDAILEDCEELLACYSDDYLPLVYRCYARSRPTLLGLLKVLEIQSLVPNDALIQAKAFLLSNVHLKRDLLPAGVGLSFASENWKKLVLKKDKERLVFIRKHFEVCILSCLANELKATNLWVTGSASFTDFRSHLMDYAACELLIPDYCKTVAIPQTGKEAVTILRQQLTEKARAVDASYPQILDLTIDDQGRVTLHKTRRPQKSSSAKALAARIQVLMPERNLIDILANAHHYAGWAHAFGPLSGSEPKFKDAIERYLLTTFAYGTGMGPTQAAQHMKANISAHMLSWINRRHVTTKMQDQAIAQLVNYYSLFDLTQSWGLGEAAIADGSLRAIYEENLISQPHFRHGKRGGIAYRHIANTYIALFSTFTTCGVWEAVEILEGLLKNVSELQPKIIHSDTKGQSTVVFGLGFFLAIQLMPRIRNWKDLIFFRPSKYEKYSHIDCLFKDSIDWDLIQTHWQDMLQVALSIKSGTISSSVLLRKLTSYSRKNKIYQAFRELGRLLRTLFLLDYISQTAFRENITTQTNKIEAYHSFVNWLSFGNPYSLIASNDPDEHEKIIKYNTILANAVMLQNVIDVSEALIHLDNQRYPIQRRDLGHSSPLMTAHIKRFGDYFVNLNIIPKPPNHILKLSFL